jgi:ADP-ribose pyrophosphatase YjhB (NUDIX family)
VGAVTGWRYCPRCAAELRHEGGHVECGACGFMWFAASFPTVSAFVFDDRGDILLARRAHDPDVGKWDAPGGFLEEGEDPIDGLRRELLEETGLEIDVRDFVGAFIDTYDGGGGTRSVLNLVWTARVVSGEPVAADDVSELGWFSKDRLPPDEELAFRWFAPVLRDWAAEHRRAGNRPFG